MTDGERELVKSINKFFTENSLKGIAYRRKQHRFSSQFVDILVNTAEEDLNDVAIEHKSFKKSSSSKLYFSQHFSDSEKEDSVLGCKKQVERVKEFQRLSGFNTFLGVEVKRGRGRSRRQFILPWSDLYRLYESGESGVSIPFLEEEGVELEKTDDNMWRIPDRLFF